ncbi:precorrin-6Y C5,15-methyltransferase (decarboxylating) [Ancylomarina subtilis]|uniref:Precorrin-6Y C5,15-methyltransferase (Decarboxylating) n=1 Tax=Ancylomarina subtilis TaxID=1639035 RepID=A0A4Q7VJN6_9BACT|nr:precorrin-6y C5,15-methyltransferase (decarboxylating) subunit CbiE [Ancylomarina subtilis]RZT96393.1 precorrin-6Y C5,15-methyltransferase (decarboxylating) [Ancylomarina subtilis]
MSKFVIIGITDMPHPNLNREAIQYIAESRFFSGGIRHKELIQDYLPENSEWIDITVPLTDVFDQYRQIDETIVVIASGDPLFYGIGNTIKREFPDAELKVFPAHNSLQLLAHHYQLEYGKMHIATLTGRDWAEIDLPLIRGEQMIGVLTDRQKTPNTIAQYLLDYGFDNYDYYLGEKLGGPNQNCQKLSIEELLEVDFVHPNCMILVQKEPIIRQFGIPDEAFRRLEGRPKMMTKSLIRLASLSSLQLDAASVLWDVGYCTGSVSIEAKQAFPKLKVLAFEKRTESDAIIRDNMKNFHVPGIEIHNGDFFEQDLDLLPAPDRIFIGGHGGRLSEMMQKLYTILKPDGCIVFNAVSDETLSKFKESALDLGMRLEKSSRIQLGDFNPIEILKAIKEMR